MREYSFVWRLAFALVLWTLGGFVLVHGLSVQLLELFPALERWPRSISMFLLGTGFIIVGFTFGGRGISSFRELRRSLAAVREGDATRVHGRYPREIQPVVDDLNTLLERREHDVERARAQATDLAHGLKTPLSLIEREAERARARGDGDLAADVSEQVWRMRRQVDYHLARARAAASGPTPGVRTRLHDALEPLKRTLHRLYPDKAVTIELDVVPEHAVRCQREDVDEMLGNLLDNACKWAASRIAVRSRRVDTAIEIAVDDDGPGIPKDRRSAASRRGVRLDASPQGTGFGLAIVSDLAELYGGAVELGDSPLGGLRARLTLPAN